MISEIILSEVKRIHKEKLLCKIERKIVTDSGEEIKRFYICRIASYDSSVISIIDKYGKSPVFSLDQITGIEELRDGR